jgi:hypothetical protein
MGYKTATLIAPNQLRKIVFPWTKKVAQIAHAAGKPFLLHCCGYRESIMEDLINDIKIDAIHSFEDIIMPVTEAKKRYGESIAILGGIDMDVLGRYPLHEAEVYIDNVITKCAPGGNFAIGSGNSAANYLKIENYKVKVSAEGNSKNPDELYEALIRNLSTNKYDIIVLPFFSLYIITSLKIAERYNDKKGILKIIEIIKKLERVLLPSAARQFIRTNIFHVNKHLQYMLRLEKCINIIHQNNPSAKIILMTPVCPASKSLSIVRVNFEKHREDLINLAKASNIEVADIYKALEGIEPETIFQQDEFHLTTVGQKVVLHQDNVPRSYRWGKAFQHPPPNLEPAFF